MTFSIPTANKAALELVLETVPVINREDVKTDEDKCRLLISLNFGRSKNREAKQRKAIAKYVELVGFQNGKAGLQRMNSPDSHNENLDKNLTLSQIAFM